MYEWTPDSWTRTVNYLNASPPREFWANMVDAAVTMPASMVGLLLGLALVVLGFRLRRS